MSGSEQGSVWRKWDLHVHSPFSILNNQFPKTNEGPDWNRYLETLEALTDISVLGITDYFTIDGYKRLRREMHNGRLTNIDLILPNIEFRLDKFVASKKDGKKPRRLNLHVIFSDKVPENHIEEKFLHNLEFVSARSVAGSTFSEKLKPANIMELGQTLIDNFSTEYANKSPMVVGAENVTVSLDQILRELENTLSFRDKYLIILEKGYTDLIAWGSSDTNERKTLMQASHMVFSSKEKDRLWCLGKAPYEHGESRFIASFDSLKPCIHGSDAHSLARIGKPCGIRHKHDCENEPENCEHRFCWIKADPTFEGLRQVLYEPEARVHLGPESPELARSNYTISAVRLSETIIDKELTVSETEIPLNRSLVAVTGGKGAGKTAFVDLIANCFLDRVSKRNDNSFAWRICKDRKPPLRVSLDFTGGEAFEKDVFDSETVLKQVDVAYVEQGQLDADVSETFKLTEKIEQLVQSRASKSETYRFETLGNKISDIGKDMREKLEQIILLSSKVSGGALEKLETRKKALAIEIEDLSAQIAEHSLDDGEVELAQKTNELLSGLNARFEKLRTMQKHIERAQSILTNELPEYNDVVTQINGLAQELDLKAEVIPVVEYSKSALLDGLAERVENEVASILERIDASNRELEDENKRVADHSKLIEDKRVAENKLDKVENQLGQIDKTEKTLKDLRDTRASLYFELLQTIEDHRRSFERMMSSFMSKNQRDSDATDSRTVNILSGLNFAADIQFSRLSFLNSCKDVFDGRSITQKDDESYFDPTIELLAQFADRHDGEAIAALSRHIENLAKDPRLANSIVSRKSLIDCFEVLYGNHFSLAPKVTYRNVPLEHLSIGQKSTVLLKLYLADGVRPIIIDSHDDYLDNKFIYDELIPALCEAKKRRQVILVSNNANVVVNADAEQVIIAEHQANTISYTSGSLENPVIRESAIEVLEGGKEAFANRQKKYRMN